MARVAWVIGGTPMPVNPNTMTTVLSQPVFVPRTDGSAAYTDRDPTVPRDFSFGGNVYSQTQYDFLADWVEGGGRTVITDHLGRSFVVLPVSFDPVDRRHGMRTGRTSWGYTVKCLLLGQVGGGLG